MTQVDIRICFSQGAPWVSLGVWIATQTASNSQPHLALSFVVSPLPECEDAEDDYDEQGDPKKDPVIFEIQS